MMNAAKKLDVRTVHQEIGVVAAAEEQQGSGLFTVDTDEGRLTARRATSCLVAPQPGDRVLVVIESRRDRVPGDVFVLAVLERHDETTTTIALDGDVVVRASEKLSLTGVKGVDVVGSAGVRIAGSTIGLTALRTRVASHVLELVGEAATADLGSAKLVARTFDAVLDRLTHRVKRAFRFVEETEQVKARHLDYAAREVAHLRGETTVVTARDLVKVNGEQIHVG